MFRQQFEQMFEHLQQLVVLYFCAVITLKMKKWIGNLAFAFQRNPDDIMIGPVVQVFRLDIY